MHIVQGPGGGCQAAPDDPVLINDSLGGRVSPAQRARVWMARAQAGDAAAFGLVYDQYAHTVFRFIRSRVDSHEVAEDLTQEAFVRAWRNIAAWVWRGVDPVAWLVTIARHLVADHRKAASTRRTVVGLDVPAVGRRDRADVSPEGDPAGTVERRVTAAAVRAAVQRLLPRHRQCITLRYLEGLSLAETAAAMATSVSVVKTLQVRAQRALSQVLTTGAVIA